MIQHLNVCMSESESEWALLARYVYTYEEFVIVTKLHNATEWQQQDRTQTTKEQYTNRQCMWIMSMCDSLSCSTYAGVCQHVSEHAGLPLAVVVSFAVSMREGGGGGGGGGGALDRAVDPVLGTLEILSQHCTDCGLTPPQGALVLWRRWCICGDTYTTTVKNSYFCTETKKRNADKTTMQADTYIVLRVY